MNILNRGHVEHFQPGLFFHPLPILNALLNHLSMLFDTYSIYIPENILAIAAIKKLSITPGPAIVLATIPATRYMPVPQHEPTPKDVRSNVVRHF